MFMFIDLMKYIKDLVNKQLRSSSAILKIITKLFRNGLDLAQQRLLTVITCCTCGCRFGCLALVTMNSITDKDNKIFINSDILFDCFYLHVTITKLRQIN